MDREERGSEVPFVAAITHVMYGVASHDVTTPDGLWDIVIQRHAGKVKVLQTGLITSPIALDYLEGDEYLSISFKVGVFMPRLPGQRMVDTAMVRPLTTQRTFALDSDELEIPSFENAEGLVERLVKREIIVRDEIVSEVAEGGSEGLSPRTVQRHFVHALGLSPKGLAQIQRANRAVALLRAGRAVVDVAMDLGYADQPHLTRSLKRFIGRTPGEIAASVGESQPAEHG